MAPTAATSAASLWWNTPVLAPLKILVVFFHKIGHGFGAVLTGGSPFIVLKAGYLGSLVIGSLLILGATFFRRDRILAGLLGAALGVITLLYVHNLAGFFFGLAAAAGIVGNIGAIIASSLEVSPLPCAQIFQKKSPIPL